MRDTDFFIVVRMQTTLNLRDNPVAQATALAVKECTTLTTMIEEGARAQTSTAEGTIGWCVEGFTGIRPERRFPQRCRRYP